MSTNHQVYDDILSKIPIDGLLTDLWKKDDANLKYIESLGYITVSGILMLEIHLTSEGIKLKTEGGFAKKIKDTKKEALRMWLPIGISALLFIMALLTYAKTITQVENSDDAIEIINGKIDKLNLRLDSLSTIKHTIKETDKQATAIDKTFKRITIIPQN